MDRCDGGRAPAKGGFWSAKPATLPAPAPAPSPAPENKTILHLTEGSSTEILVPEPPGPPPEPPPPPELPPGEQPDQLSCSKSLGLKPAPPYFF